MASQSDGSTHTKSMAWEGDAPHHINDPDADIDSGPKATVDICNYFDKSGKKKICKLCRFSYVLGSSVS